MEKTPCTMKEIIDYAAGAYGEQDAFRYKAGKEVANKTYADLQKDSRTFSRVLEKYDMKGKHVAVIGPTTYEWIITYFGTVNSGGVIVPVDALLPAKEVCELLNRADVSVFVYDELRRDVAKIVKECCPDIKYVISMQKEKSDEEGLSLPELMKENQGTFSCEIDPDRMCAILFTSGTTGKSKGVMLTHRNLTENAVCLDMKIPQGTVSMTVLPIHHAYCFTMDILKAIYIGIIICINDSVMHVSKNFKLFKPEIVLFVPMIVESVYARLKAATGVLPKKLIAKSAFGGNLKTIVSGGAYLPPELVENFKEYGITVLQGYGMTECSPVISTNTEWEAKAGSVGKLLPNCEAKVVENEIWVKGSSVMLGYYKMPEETKEALADGWLRTGDLGYVDEDGFVFLTGRKKNLIILKNGENVSPEELENQLYKNPLIKEIIVREKDNIMEAEIFPDLEYAGKKKIRDVEGKLQEILDDFNKKMPVYKRIHGLKVRKEEFEKTPSKKIKRY